MKTVSLLLFLALVGVASAEGGNDCFRARDVRRMAGAGRTYAEMRAEVLRRLCADRPDGGCREREAWTFADWNLWLGCTFLAEELNEARLVFRAPSKAVAPSVTPACADVTVAARRSGTDYMLICVNDAAQAVEADMPTEGMPRVLHLGGERLPTRVDGPLLKVALGPKESKVFLSRPWRFSAEEAGRQVARFEELRRKPGNLAVAPCFRTSLAQGGADSREADSACAFPRVDVSSAAGGEGLRWAMAYVLQDGMCEICPLDGLVQAWTPDDRDCSPWVRVDFGEETSFDEVVLHLGRDGSGECGITSGRVEVDGRTVASFSEVRRTRVELHFPRTRARSVTFRPGPRNARAKAPCLLEVEVYDAVAVDSEMLATEAARIERLVEEKFFNAGELAMSSLQWDYAPWSMPEPSDRSVFRIPGQRSTPVGQRAWENSPMVMGEFLVAMEKKYRVTGDDDALRLMRRCYNGLRKIYVISQPIGEGFFCKPYGGVVSDETSSDQYVYAVQAFDAYFGYASDAEKADICGMIAKMADYWMGIDYNRKYFGRPLQWQRCRFLSLLKMAEKYSGEAKYAKEIGRILSSREDAVESPYQCDLEYHHRGGLCPDGRVNYGINAEASLSGFLAVANLKGDSVADWYYRRTVEKACQEAIVGLDPDGTAYRAIVKNDETGEFEEKDPKLTVYKTPDQVPSPWNFAGGLVSGPLRFGGQMSAAGVNALVQMAPDSPQARSWTDVYATKLLYRIARAHLSHVEDPHRLYTSGARWQTLVRSGDAHGMWLWAYWTLRERNAVR